jgi:energy-coupling factor transporter ATP-binding protein EcfA2
LLAEAIASPRVRVLLIEEPGVRLEPRAARRLGGVLREFARDGRVVLVVTSSARDADALADDTWQLRAGCLLPPCSPAASLGLEPSATGINLHLVVSDPRALTAALARESDVEGVTYDDAGLRVHGSNAIALAEAIGRTVAATEVVVFELRMEGGDATSPYRPRDTAGATDRPGREFT